MRACGNRALDSSQDTLRIGPTSAPQPDVVVLGPRADYYRFGEKHSLSDVLLIIEFARRSFHFDYLIKRQLYAGAGIPEYWIPDLATNTIKAEHAAYTAEAT